MDERKLYQLLNFILNDAESHELDVIRAALRKREGKGLAGDSPDFGKNIRRMAREMGEKVSGQIGASEEQIRKTVRSFVRDMIRREAPELREAQVDELIDQWVPDPRSPRPEAGGKGAGTAGRSLPPDVLLTMIRQFTAYSTGKMSIAEEAELSGTMADWQKRYWMRFSSVVRRLVSLYVKGITSERDFWDGVYDELGLDANGSPSDA
ncbi:MAG: hypothetical protein JW852_12285 [Spirochaetales bacterium]|nr:hypothetical protein [Spirochaetales bacterium]